MNGSSAVLDSNILIYRSKGQIDFRSVTVGYTKIYVSAITYMEALGYNFPTFAEQQMMEKLLAAFEIIQTDVEISEQVVEYRRKSKIKLPDAIILATAKKLNADLISVNEQDFINVDLNVKIIRPPLI